jgi:signal peptidase II
MFYLLLAAGIFAADFYLKTKIEITPEADLAKTLANGHIELTRLHNKGLAGSRLKDKPWLATLISGIVFILCLIYSLVRFIRRDNGMEKAALAMICAGAAGNFFDRLGRGYVVDYLSFSKSKIRLIKKYVYNLADLFIFLGSAILILLELFRKK